MVPQNGADVLISAVSDRVPPGHCEERSDEAIPTRTTLRGLRLLRGA